MWTRRWCWIPATDCRARAEPSLGICFSQLSFCFQRLVASDGVECSLFRAGASGRAATSLPGLRLEGSPAGLALWCSCVSWTARGSGWLSRHLFQVSSELGTENLVVGLLREEAAGMPPAEKLVFSPVSSLPALPSATCLRPPDAVAEAPLCRVLMVGDGLAVQQPSESWRLM